MEHFQCQESEPRSHLQKIRMIKEEERTYEEDSNNIYDSAAHKLGLFDKADISTLNAIREENGPFLQKLAIRSKSPALHRAL